MIFKEAKTQENEKLQEALQEKEQETEKLKHALQEMKVQLQETIQEQEAAKKIVEQPPTVQVFC